VSWKLIFALSMLGLAMAFATVSFIPSRAEPLVWLAILIVCAFFIARLRPDRAFLHGLVLGLVNSIWVTGAHMMFFQQYIANHPQEAAMTKSMPLPNSPRLMMALVGPPIGIVSGAVIGLSAMAINSLRRRFRRDPTIARREHERNSE